MKWDMFYIDTVISNFEFTTNTRFQYHLSYILIAYLVYEYYVIKFTTNNRFYSSFQKSKHNKNIELQNPLTNAFIQTERIQRPVVDKIGRSFKKKEWLKAE